MLHLSTNFHGNRASGFYVILLRQTDRQTNTQTTENITSLAEVITIAVGVFIVKGLQAYSVVTDSGLYHLMGGKNCVTMSPPAHISAAKLYETSQRETENELTQTPYLTFSTDSWNSRVSESYLTVVEKETRPSQSCCPFSVILSKF